MSCICMLSVVIFFPELYFHYFAAAFYWSECSYTNTINVTDLPTLENGSYIYDDQTTIPQYLVSDYNYEILYNGTTRSVPMHKRACFCHLKPCIPLCSNNMLEFYQDVLNDVDANKNFKDLFVKTITLANKTETTKNLVEDFAHIILNSFCEYRFSLSPETDQNNDWTLFEDGTLLRHSDQVLLRKNEYCFELYLAEIENETYSLINPFNCAQKKEGLNDIQLFHYWKYSGANRLENLYEDDSIFPVRSMQILTEVLSLPFFLLTIIAYFSLPELRDVHGKCFMTYLSSLTTSYSILSFINLSQINFNPMPCLLMGYLNHYMQLSQYTWLGIISLDTWKCFSDYAYRASYHKYALYGYHIPLIMTFLTFLAQHSELMESLKPGISPQRCGLEVNKWSALIYLYGPCSILLICCLIFFILTSRIIKTNDKDVGKINELQFESPRSRYALYMRLFLMMGLSWFLDIISYFLNMLKKSNLSELIDYINALQGLYVFVNFIGRARVRNIIISRFSNLANSCGPAMEVN